MDQKRLLFSIAAIFLYAISCMAQEGPLATDRPDQTESPEVVAKHYLQVETGFQYEKSNFDYINSSEKVYKYNTTLLRYGLVKGLEVRLGIDLLEAKNRNNYYSENHGAFWSPLLVGGKLKITKEKNWLPYIALLAHAYLPFPVKEAYRPANTDFEFRFAFSYSLNEKSSLSWNLGAGWFGNHINPELLYTLTYAYRITEKLGMFAEVYGNFYFEEGPKHYWDGGLTYLVSSNFQLDAYAGRGFDNEQNLLMGAGVSVRIPLKKEL